MESNRIPADGSRLALSGKPGQVPATQNRDEITFGNLTFDRTTSAGRLSNIGARVARFIRDDIDDPVFLFCAVGVLYARQAEPVCLPTHF